MSVAFWSVTVSNNKPVEVQPPEGFVLNVQQAALVGASKGSQVLRVKTQAIEGDDLDAVIGTLRPTTADQISFSLVFGYDVPVTFTTTGDANGTVHISGYYQPGPDDDEEGSEGFDGEEGDSEDEDSEDDASDNELNAKLAEESLAKLKNAHKKEIVTNSKGKVVQLPSESEESSEDEEDSEDEALDNAFVAKMQKKAFASKPATPAAKKGSAPVPESEDESEEDDEDSEDGSDDDDEEDEEDSEDEAPPMKVQKSAPKGTVVNSKPAAPQQNKAPQQQQNAFKSNNNTPNKPQQGGNPNKFNPNQGGNKTPQGGNNKPNHNNHNSGNKFQQSGDKRKR